MLTPRIQLALDASAGPASVALFVDGQLVQARRIDRKGSAELLAPTIAELLAVERMHARELTDIIVGAGPGSFTGLRVAAALAKGLARGAAATLHAAPSLPMIAAAAEDCAAAIYLNVLDALRGEWFVQRSTKHADGRWTVDGTVDRLPIDVVRTRATALGALIVGPPVMPEQQPDARAALLIGTQVVPLDTWEPDYGRLAEAQVQWEATHERALPAS